LIVLKTLKFSNAFSYGENNEIDFTRSPLVQLVGKNGHGKSSIALILEEVLFNKNSKGIKKGDILNRYSKAKHYSIELEFQKDGCNYKIETRRGSTQTVKFTRENQDISSHTATQTYKQIEEVLGMDHKTFSQIVYQSHASSLEFLTSPDTARKKFLIEILNLGRYTQAGEVFKAAHGELAKEVAAAEAKVATTTSWIQKYASTDFTRKPLVVVPQQPDTERQQLAQIEAQLSTLTATNKRIVQNNKYKELQSKIKVLPLPPEPKELEEPYTKAAANAAGQYAAAKAIRDKMGKLHGTCPTCLSEIDECKTTALVAEQEQLMAEASALESSAMAEVKRILAARTAWTAAQKSQEDWEKYHQLIDTSLPDVLLDEATLKASAGKLQQLILATAEDISRAEYHNKQANAENAKLALIEGQVAEMQADLSQHKSKLAELQNRLSVLATLVKTFSTTGLVAYKIENLVKDLEELSNQYLGELSGGRFQIGFQISGSDKLNVVITDNGTDIDIAALSGGERARVNVATLLAIRRLMQSLSQSRINLLILDETVEALDVDGKEKLIEVLLAEDNLNTVLVSHGFTHALLEKVYVVKHNNISHIEV
jgi:DNA repair exonuclease SbcCD ATPase subunit